MIKTNQTMLRRSGDSRVHGLFSNGPREGSAPAPCFSFPGVPCFPDFSLQLSRGRLFSNELSAAPGRISARPSATLAAGVFFVQLRLDPAYRLA